MAKVLDIEETLKTATLIVDTREQPTPRAKARLAATGLPFVREALPAGDYSLRMTRPDGSIVDLSKAVAIERKMHLDELCSCYTRERNRFVREFERAKENGTKVYLMVENASWDFAIMGRYKSQMTTQSLIASMIVWMIRYDTHIVFVSELNSGRMIKEILLREAKAYLEAEEEDGI
jgi:ERCC4-type nuclease